MKDADVDTPLGEIWRGWLLEGPCARGADAPRSPLRELFDISMKQAREGDLKAVALLLDRAYGKTPDAREETSGASLGELVDSLG